MKGCEMSASSSLTGSISVVGLLISHRNFGLCKIEKVSGNIIQAIVCGDGGIRQFSKASLVDGDVKRAILSPGTPAIGPNGKCSIDRRIDGTDAGPYSYRIIYEDTGLAANHQETELLPLPVTAEDTLQARLLEYRTDRYALFAARHRLLVALGRYNRQVGGLHALLSSRVDLHPHQAFVAGTVILDPVRRYILADEVGLGKTIEAGIIIHDLLSRRPDARVLVLTPPSLARQWLCELHSGFGGQGFRLGDLHPIDKIDVLGWSKVICSTSLALEGIGENLLSAPWDMVVVDEVHHLLNFPRLYDLVLKLSLKSRDLLLLSAVPARQRETELYRLLVLLDPHTYDADGTGEESFLAVYGAQEAIGRRLNLLAHDLDDFKTGLANSEDVLSRLQKLLSLPILSSDDQLKSMLRGAEENPDDAAAIALEAHLIVSDRYRVNRRILRNRRERLISQERLTAITRRPTLHLYEPDQIEREGVASVERLLSKLSAVRGLSPDIIQPFTRILLQALVDPTAVMDVLDLLRNQKSADNNSSLEVLNGVIGLGGERWRTQLELACQGVASHIEQAELNEAYNSVRNWHVSTTSARRLDQLIALLKQEVGASRKTLIFAGFPTVANRLAIVIRAQFGKVVTEFRSDLDDALKEENVRKFRVETGPAIMICDESGGEGRNFQFANSLVHFDLPWQPAVVEQRIGRLDRLGRETVSTEVISHVMTNSESWEVGLYACYHEGLNLFGCSISGLEFALRDIQGMIVDRALEDGIDGLYDLAPSLKKIASDERTRDESEALLDEASYHAARAERFARTTSRDSEEQLEGAFLDYFRALASGKGIMRKTGVEGDDRIWTLRPDDIPNGELSIVDKSDGGELRKRVGTFSREVARRHRDAEFFTYGNPLFDAVVLSMGSRLTARTYAISCSAPGLASFIGFEVIIAARPQISTSEISPSLQNLAESIFGTRRRPLFVPLNKNQLVNGLGLAEMRTSLSLSGVGHKWKDLNGSEIERLVDKADGDLGSCYQRIIAEELPAARKTFSQELTGPIQAEVSRIDTQIKLLMLVGDAASVVEAAMLQRYRTLLESWDVVIDGIGFLAVNARG